MVTMATSLVFFLACLSLALADYDCVCNYNVEEVVHAAPTDTSATVGYMYEFDCKEHIPVASLGSSWLAVAFEHRQGYVQANSAVQIQKCQGSPPAEDRVTTTTSTTAATTTTSSTPTPMPITTTTTTSTTTQLTTTTTTATPTTTTPKPTTTTTKPTTTTTQTTTTTPQPTTTTTTTPKPATTTPQPTTTTTTTPKLTTTTPQQTTSTTNPTTTTLRPTTATTQSTTTKTQSTTTTTKPTTPTTTTTTLKPTTTTFKPTTTTHNPTTTTNKPSTTHRPVTHAPITLKPTTHTPSVTGSGSSCYNTQHHYSHNIKGTLTSNGNICYEFVTSNMHWLDAENDCRSKGGHLAHIANAQEQTYIYNFLKTHYNHRVWIGLHDRQTEEQFQWTSGSPVTYTHWAPDRYSFLHTLYDCVELDPTDNGFWKDMGCSTFLPKTYGYVCQYGGSGVSFR